MNAVGSRARSHRAPVNLRNRTSPGSDLLVSFQIAQQSPAQHGLVHLQPRRTDRGAVDRNYSGCHRSSAADRSGNRGCLDRGHSTERYTRHDDTSKEFGVADEELNSLRDAVDLIRDERTLQNFVQDVETVIAKEQSVWVARR